MQKKVVVIHTSFVSVDHLKGLFKEILPEVEMINIVDDSLLAEVMANGKITPGIVSRMCTYGKEAEAMGADAILNQCSSVGEAADIVRQILSIPVIKIDEAMAETAVGLGKTIAVVATVASTLGPSVRLVESAARKMNKEVNIVPCLVEGALDILMKEGNREKHNQMVLKEIEKYSETCDVIVLAQGSMIVLLPELSHILKPVLTSPSLGVKKLRETLLLDIEE